MSVRLRTWVDLIVDHDIIIVIIEIETTSFLDLVLVDMESSLETHTRTHMFDSKNM